MSGTAQVMTIGALSRRTGVSVKTLRQYADSGMVCSRGRSPANYRLFDSDALCCLRRIDVLRGLGLRVAEIRGLFCSQEGPRLAELLRASRERVHERIADLQQTLRRVDEYEAEHQATLTTGELCWSAAPDMTHPTLDSHPGGRP